MLGSTVGPVASDGERACLESVNTTRSKTLLEKFAPSKFVATPNAFDMTTSTIFEFLNDASPVSAPDNVLPDKFLPSKLQLLHIHTNYFVDFFIERPAGAREKRT